MSSVSALVEEARDFIRDNWSKDIDLAEWREKVVDAKWAALRWPVDSYGRGLNDEEAEAVEAVFSEAGISGPGQDKFNLWAGTLVGFGTDELKQQYVRRLLLDEVAMCLLYSEPGAGSDLAGIRTTAVRDGDEWVINGQKVWTSGAKGADIGMLIARTDWDQPKHRGISFFYFPMKQPGVEVRPLRQMTGEAEFNEVYFTDTRVPVSETLGNAGDGWRVSLTTLMNERVAIGGAIPQKGSGPIREAVKLWEKLPADRKDAATKDKLMKLWIRSEIARLTNIRAGQNRKVGVPGPEGSIGKMASAELNKETYELCIELLGAEGMLYGSYEMVRPDSAMTFDYIPKAFLRARANSIEGGTSEVMRNILGERVLGLPGDVRVDREMPWSKVPRN